MFIVTVTCLLIVAVFFSIQVLSLWAIGKPDHNALQSFDQQPKISLLLAARNEEQLIVRSLKAIADLDYPSDLLEVLIGDDSSTDRTAELVNDFIADKPNFHLFTINKTLGKGRGKANVLAHLAHKASGEFFFITDVDVKLPPGWINSLLEQFTPDVGIVSGTSTCEPRKEWFAMMQSIDWLHFMGYIQSFANIGVACTSVGNNMAVRATTYWETGGYENIDFSITEDYKLFKEVTNRGWEWRTILTPNSLGLAWHIPTVSEMLHQRKRWLIGARELPFNWKFLIILYGLFVPALAALIVLHPWIALCIWLMKFLIQTVYIRALCKKVGLQPFSISNLVSYEVYVLLDTLLTAIFYFSPIRSVWKGRTYSSNDLV